MARVTQIAVFEEFNVFLLIADRSLIAYHLDVVCPASGMNNQTTSDSARRAPQKLSGNREVGFFAAGQMKDRTLVMYKKRDGLSSTFKVCLVPGYIDWHLLTCIRFSSRSCKSRQRAAVDFSVLAARRRSFSASTTSSISLRRVTA